MSQQELERVQADPKELGQPPSRETFPVHLANQDHLVRLEFARGHFDQPLTIAIASAAERTT